MREAVLRHALAYVGTRERTGRNDGDAERFMPSWARGKGLPWCAFFVGHVWHEVFGEHPYGKHIGGVYDLWRAAVEADEAVAIGSRWPALELQPGDAFVMLAAGGRKRSTGHTGFVLRVSEDGERINTVEGNFRNGVGVATRPTRDFVAAVNLYGRLCGEHSSVTWARGLIDAPMAGGLAGTR
jgi:hypothetical protein